MTVVYGKLKGLKDRPEDDGTRQNGIHLHILEVETPESSHSNANVFFNLNRTSGYP